MAVVQNTLIGRAKGRVGNLVFRTHKGQNIISQKAEIVANPRSGQQQANRSRFTMLMALGLLLRPIIALGFKEYSGRLSWLNKFQSTNSYSDVLIWDAINSEWQQDLNKVVISEGSLHQTELTADSATATTVTANWDNTVVANQSANDKFYGVAFSESETIYSLGTAERGNSSALFTFLTSNAGNSVTIVGYFINNAGVIVSNSFNTFVEVA